MWELTTLVWGTTTSRRAGNRSKIVMQSFAFSISISYHGFAFLLVHLLPEVEPPSLREDSPWGMVLAFGGRRRHPAILRQSAMSTIHLSIVDWLIIAIYFAFVLGIGFYFKKFTKNQEDFFLAGRKNSSWVAGLAFLSANLGALELLGMTGNTYKYGMYVAHFYWIGAVPAMLFLGLYMMPFYFSSKIHSVPGYLKLRFDEKTRVLNGVAFAVMTLLVSGINLYAMALVLHTFLGWNWDVSMWVSAVDRCAFT